jgi:hypothetical protein
MNNIIVHSTFAVVAPVFTGGKLFYQLFYHNIAGNLIASSLREEVLP